MTTKTLELKELQFKDTEIGAIPDEWNLISFGEAFDFLRTASYSRDQLGSVGDVQYIHYGDVHTKWNYYVDLSKERIPTIDSSMAGLYAKIRKGDLVVVDASEDFVGLSKSVEVTGLSEKEAISGLHTFLLRDKGSNFVDGYRGYITSSPLVKPSLDRYATGMKVFGVSKTNLKLVLIPRPPKEEQEEIVKALRDTDALIESLEKLIAKKLVIKQGAMQELLTGKRRLPGFTSSWSTKRLGEVVDPITGGIYGLESPSADVHPFPVATTAQIDEDDRWNNKPMATRYFTKAQIEGYSPRTGDLVVVKSSGSAEKIKSGKIGYVTQEIANRFVFSNFLMVLRPTGVIPMFLYYFLTSHAVKSILPSLCEASTYPNLRIPEYLAISVPSPSPDEQSAIAATISEMGAEITLLEKTVQKYRKVKTGMMHSLLTGKIRLAV